MQALRSCFKYGALGAWQVIIWSGARSIEPMHMFERVCLLTHMDSFQRHSRQIPFGGTMPTGSSSQFNFPVKCSLFRFLFYGVAVACFYMSALSVAVYRGERYHSHDKLISIYTLELKLVSAFFLSFFLAFFFGIAPDETYL